MREKRLFLRFEIVEMQINQRRIFRLLFSSMAQVNNICNNIDTPLVYLLTDNCNTILLIINCAVNTFSRIALLTFIFVIIIAFCFVVYLFCRFVLSFCVP